MPRQAGSCRLSQTLGALKEFMQTITVDRKNSPSMIERLALAVALSLLVALFLAIVLPQLKPGIFGSDFEGSSGYMAIFIFVPAVTLVLTPILFLSLRKASRFACLCFWFLVQLVFGFFFLNLIFGSWLGNTLWLGGLVALSLKMLKQWRSQA